jgi:hypothetical protein
MMEREEDGLPCSGTEERCWSMERRHEGEGGTVESAITEVTQRSVVAERCRGGAVS